jgi:TonB-linked SusC/RagA family outer membrane protein
MKIIFFLITVLVTQVNANSFAQKITLSQKNISLEQLFREIKLQTGYNIFYSDQHINSAERVDVKFDNKPLREVLSETLRNRDLTFVISEKDIMIKPKTISNAGIQDAFAKIDCKGRVVDTEGKPLPGASVVVKGTKKTAITTENGEFSLSAVDEGVTIVISYIGYLQKEVKASRSMGNIVLEVEDSKLNEIVVVGYGTQKKSSLTAAVASVSAKEIQKQVTSNVASALQGRTPGVEIVQQAGVAGADVNILIRGAASFGTTEPLYVVDGIFSNSGLTTMNPADIESIEILKDGAAAAIYGSRAANGVVLITTKKGRAGKVKVEINATYAAQVATKIPEFLNATEWRSFANTVADNSGLPHAPENDNPSNPNINTDWTKEWLQYAPLYNINGGMSGGSENSTFNTSFGYLDQTGMTIYSDYKRYNFRVNHTYKKGIFSISENLGLTNRKTTPTTPFNISLPTLPVYDAEGRLTSGGPEYYINPEDGRAQNKIAPLYYTDRYTNSLDILGGVNASLKFSKDFEYRFSAGGNYTASHDYTHTPIYYSKYNADGTPNKDYGNNVNSLSEGRGGEFTYTLDNILAYNKTINKHTIDALLGTSWMREYNRNVSIGTIADLGGTSITGVSNVDGKISAGESNSALLSFFTRVNYDFDNKYLLSATLRRDESSKFYKDSRVGFFPSVSVGWNLDREDFFKTDLVSKLKFRGSYGELGANFLNPYNFDPIAFGPIPYILGDTRYVNGRGAYLKSRGLKWETAKTTNLGIDASLLKDKIYFTFDYFIKKNTDLLAAIDLNLSSGQVFEINTSREKPYVNTASVENKGWEFLMGYRNSFSNDLKVDASFNISAIKNKVIALGNNVQPINSGGISSFFNDPASITRPGNAIGSFYGYKIDGFDSGGNFIFTDVTKDGIVNANDKVILGTPIPDFSYGFNLLVNYKNFDLTVFIQGVSGNEIFNAKKYTNYFDYSNNVVKDVLNAWSPTNKNTNIPIMKTQNTNGGNSLPSEFYIEDGSYLRVKNLQLGYNLSEKTMQKLKLSNLRIFASVQNLFTITNYTGYDPEVSSNALFSRGIDFNSFPNARMYNLGLNLSF